MSKTSLNKYLTKLDRGNTNFVLQLFEYFKKATWGKEYDFLKYYQNLVRIYVNDIDMDSRGLLVVHTMGMGKSILAISIAIDLMKERQPIILLTKSLQENMRGAIVKYVKLRTVAEPDYHLGALSDPELNDWIERNFSFVSMNASNMLKQMGKAAEGNIAEEFDTALEKKFGEVLKLASLDGKLLIVDEAHNLFRAITNGSKNAIGLYDLIMKSKNLKIMFFTGTPIANDSFELVPCFNMLGSRTGRPILPESYKDFNKLFVDIKNGRIKNKERFQNRLFGLVSHIGRETQPGKAFNIQDPATRAEFPSEEPVIVERVNMDPEQFVMYQLARDKEKEEGSSSKFGPGNRIVETASMTKPKSQAASTYRVKSRQLSNFSPPPGFRDETSDKIPEQYLSSAKYRRVYENIQSHVGQLGLVYSQFVGTGGLGTFSRFLESNGWVRIKNTEPAEYTLGGDMYSVTGPSVPTADHYIQRVEESLNTISPDTWWLSRENTVGGDDSIDSGETIMNILDQINTEYELRYATPSDEVVIKEFHKDYVKSEHPVILIFNKDKIVGYAVIEDGVITDEYFSSCAGVIAQLKKIIHDTIHGKSAFSRDITGGTVDVSNIQPRKFAIISGDVDISTRSRIQEMFNSDENKHGGVIDLILVSSTGAEGLDLKNVRHIHVMEPYWNWGRVQQIIARGVRNDSHKALPEAEKNVQPYIYLAIPPTTERLASGEYPPTTDTELYDESITNQVTIESFNDALKEISIECLVNDEEHCRVCNPDNAALYTDDPARDARSADPCSRVQESQITVKEIIVGDTKYYYAPDSDSLYDYKVYIYDTTIDGYRPLPESDQKYALIVDAINAE